MIHVLGGFKRVSEKYIEGRDYRIRKASRTSCVLVIAPHGGKIEPGTSEIAEAIAGRDYSLYCFEGLKSRANNQLHIKSHRFDERSALQAVSKSEVIIAIHGQVNRKNGFIMIGGLNSDLRLLIKETLEARGFEVRPTTKGTEGCHIDNICNRGRLGAGVQLEISRILRDLLVSDSNQLHLFASSIRKAMDMYLKSQKAISPNRE